MCAAEIQLQMAVCVLQAAHTSLLLAMRYFANRFEHVFFLVVSDDPLWCAAQEMFQGENVHVVTEPHEEVLDLAILSACDHAILTMGTFGWWGAWQTVERGGCVLQR